METQDQAGGGLIAHVIQDVAAAVGQRPNESRHQQLIRAQAAGNMIEDLGPRDVAEAMLAGHCVMFHAVLADSVQETLRGEVDTMRRATRANVVALNSAFHMNFSRLDQRQTRRAKEVSDTVKKAQPPRPGDAGAETVGAQAEIAVADQLPAADPSDRQSVQIQAPPARPRIHLQTEPVPESSDENTIVFQTSPEILAVCQANPAAMAALEAGDTERFAQSVGFEVVREISLAALNPPNQASGKTAAIQPAPYRPNRRERRHPPR